MANGGKRLVRFDWSSGGEIFEYLPFLKFSSVEEGPIAESIHRRFLSS